MTSNPSLNPTESVATPPRKRRVFRQIRVTQVKQLTPHMVRVTFTGDNLAAFGWNGPASHIKLVFPEAGQNEPPLPEPEDRPNYMRTYTPRRFDPSVPELEVEFVLHGEGPASNWASQAQVGQGLVLAGPGANYQIDPDAEWFLLAGDDTALPAISSILEALPATTKAYVLMEVAGPEDEQPLYSPAPLEVKWLYRGSNAPDAVLEQALRDFQLPQGNGRIYVGSEAASMRRMRQHLLRERGLDASRIVTRGYWKLGATNYTDRDYGTD